MIIAIVILVSLLIGFIFTYNHMVKNRNRMREAWSITDVFLKKRADLIPTLTEVVKGYSEHEKTLLQEIARLRSGTMADDQQQQIDSAKKLTKALGNLIVVVENYPEIKANEHFLELQKQLSEIEGEIEKARRYYNGTVRENNTYIESFPFNIVAGIFNFRKGIFFTMDTSEKTTPEIPF